MRKKVSATQLSIEIIGVVLSVFATLFSIVTLYSFPFLVLGFTYRVPPVIYVLMEYHETLKLDDIMAPKTWVFVFFVSLVTACFFLSKILNNLLEKELIKRMNVDRENKFGQSLLFKVFFQFSFFVAITAVILYFIFHL